MDRGAIGRPKILQAGVWVYVAPCVTVEEDDIPEERGRPKRLAAALDRFLNHAGRDAARDEESQEGVSRWLMSA